MRLHSAAVGYAPGSTTSSPPKLLANPWNEVELNPRPNRRLFLRGLGGACVAAPFLSSLVERGVLAGPATPPKRLIAMFTHYGCITTRFFPVNSHGPLTAADLEPTTLKHLTPFVDKLLMPRGIRAMNEWTTQLLRGQGNDTYLQAAASYFTCQPVTPNSDDPFSFQAATKFNAQPIGPSLDHVIASQLSPSGDPLYIRVGNASNNRQSQISFSASETAYVGVGSVLDLFESLTGLTMGESAVSPDGYLVARGKSVIDVVRQDLETLERFDMSRADKHKLEAWKSLLHETTSTLVPTGCNADLLTALELNPANVDTASSAAPMSDIVTTAVTANLDVADIYSNLAVLAAVCNSNPVILLKYPASYIWKGLGIDIESASLSHRGDNAGMRGTCYPDAVNALQSIDDYYTRKFAHLLGLLDSIDEGTGTVLDNSATVWFQEVSDGCARNLNNLPIIQAGSLAGYFKTGYAVNVADGTSDLSRGNSEAQCTPETTTEYDAVSQETGTDPAVANAPINKYYCNLMNGLGVKAGEDGFPAAGGNAEVTRFGRYDRTEDFIGGSKNPPMIHDPGEFSALRANG